MAHHNLPTYDDKQSRPVSISLCQALSHVPPGRLASVELCLIVGAFNPKECRRESEQITSSKQMTGIDLVRLSILDVRQVSSCTNRFSHSFRRGTKTSRLKHELHEPGEAGGRVRGGPLLVQGFSRRLSRELLIRAVESRRWASQVQLRRKEINALSIKQFLARHQRLQLSCRPGKLAGLFRGRLSSLCGYYSANPSRRRDKW